MLTVGAAVEPPLGADPVDGYMALTTYSGAVLVMRIADCKVLLKIPPPEGEKFTSLTYCAGEDVFLSSRSDRSIALYAIPLVFCTHVCRKSKSWWSSRHCCPPPPRICPPGREATISDLCW